MVTKVRGKSKVAAAPVPVEDDTDDELEDFEDLEDADDEEDEDLEDDEDDEPAPKPKKGKAAASKKTAAPKKAAASEFNTAWLVAHVNEQTGETFDSRGVRMLLRKLAKDGTLDRTVGTDRDRYNFTGPKDETVRAVVQLIKSGAAKQMRADEISKLKERGVAKKAAKAKAKAEVVEDDDDNDESEAPVKKTKRVKPATAPAKAVPAKKKTRTK